MRGLFEVDLLPTLPPPVDDGYPRLIFFDLSAMDLPVMDRETGGLCDTYLRFQTNPAAFLLNKRSVKTSVIKRNLNPVYVTCHFNHMANKRAMALTPLILFSSYYVTPLQLVKRRGSDAGWCQP